MIINYIWHSIPSSFCSPKELIVGFSQNCLAHTILLAAEIAACCRLLARLNYIMGDYSEALIYQQRAVLMSERVLGLDHPNTITEYVSSLIGFLLEPLYDLFPATILCLLFLSSFLNVSLVISTLCKCLDQLLILNLIYCPYFSVIPI